MLLFLKYMRFWVTISNIKKEVAVVSELAHKQLDIVMSAFIEKCKTLFGNKLSDVRLFGSYARGDYCGNSDIDVMVILDMDTDEIRRNRSGICQIASDIDLTHNVNIMPVLQSKEEYEQRKSFGFYRNVELEGVSKYARQAHV